MIVDNIRAEYRDGSQVLSARVRLEKTPGTEFDLWFRFPESTRPITPVGDPFVAGLLVTCMFDGEPLRVDAPVSELLLRNVETIEFTLKEWWPREFTRVPIETAGTYAPENRPTDDRGRAMLFSLGIDSWHALLSNLDSLTHLVYVKQFDSVHRYERQQNETVAALERVSRELGKELIVVDTSLKSIADKGEAHWGKRYQGNYWARRYNGSALAAIGLCLQNTVSSLLISSTHSVPQLSAYGSHPALDTLWSSDDLNIEFDRCLKRISKVERVAECPLALETLYICLHNDPKRYNCCKCEKCYRTMLALRVCGALDRAPTFAEHPNLELLKRYPVTNRHYELWFREILDKAEDVGDTEVAEALRIFLGDQFSATRAYHLAAARGSRIGRRVLHRRILEWWDRRMASRIERLEWTH